MIKAFFRAFEDMEIVKAKEEVKLGLVTKASSSPSPWDFLLNRERMGLPAILYGIESTCLSVSGIETAL